MWAKCYVAHVGWKSKWIFNIVNAFNQSFAIVERLNVFNNFIEENGLSHAQDVTGTVTNICSAVLIIGKHGTLIISNVALTLSGKEAFEFFQCCSQNWSSQSPVNKLKISKSFL